MAGVGFFKPARSLPLVSDFLPYSGRITSLTLRAQPLPTHLMADLAADEARKDNFWDELQTFHDNLSRPLSGEGVPARRSVAATRPVSRHRPEFVTLTA